MELIDTIEYTNTANQTVKIELFVKRSTKCFIVNVTINHRTHSRSFVSEKAANNYIAELQRGY